jgi:hypothetical protein
MLVGRRKYNLSLPAKLPGRFSSAAGGYTCLLLLESAGVIAVKRFVIDLSAIIFSGEN